MTTRAVILVCGLLLLAVFAVASAGCTITRVTEGDRSSIALTFGPVVVPEVESDAIRIESRGVGLIVTGHGATLGYYKEAATYLGRRCAVYIKVANLAELDNVARALGRHPEICINRRAEHENDE